MPPTQRLLHGDAREVMARTKPEVYSAIVTDPPYGIGFMGKDWDKPRPGEDFVEYFHGGDFQRWTFLWARQALRVLKPGGYALVMAGTRLWHRTACGVEDAGFEIRDTLMWLYGTGFPKSLDVSKAMAKAAGVECPDAGLNPKWEGWGTALKPAWEPIILCRKPLIGTVAANVLEHGAGALNVDGCRVGTEDVRRSVRGGGQNTEQWRMGKGDQVTGSYAGRWPANVVLDEQAAVMLDAQSGELKGRANKLPERETVGGRGVYGNYPTRVIPGRSMDSGGASRFFYCAKASRKERGEGNDHPTVKPLALMRWLITLVTPPGAIILDPFVGSGTTLLAAAELGFRGVGIDFDEHALAIACTRLGEHCLT